LAGANPTVSSSAWLGGEGDIPPFETFLFCCQRFFTFSRSVHPRGAALGVLTLLVGPLPVLLFQCSIRASGSVTTDTRYSVRNNKTPPPRAKNGEQDITFSAPTMALSRRFQGQDNHENNRRPCSIQKLYPLPPSACPPNLLPLAWQNESGLSHTEAA